MAAGTNTSPSFDEEFGALPEEHAVPLPEIPPEEHPPAPLYPEPPELHPLPEEFLDRITPVEQEAEKPASHRLMIAALVLAAAAAAGSSSAKQQASPLLPDIIETVILQDDSPAEAEIPPELPAQAAEEQTPDTVPEPEPVPFPGESDAQLLCRMSPWNAETVSAAFFEDGSGYWLCEGFYGNFTWEEDEDGGVSLEGAATVPNPDTSSNEDSRLLSTDGAIYYTKEILCSSAVALDRNGVTAAFSNPFKNTEALYSPGSGDAEPLPGWMALTDEELLMLGVWAQADDCETGMTGASFDAAGNVTLTGRGDSASGVLVPAPDEDCAFLIQNGQDRLTLDSGTYLSPGMKISLLRTVDGPKLVFFDWTASNYWNYRSFSPIIPEAAYELFGIKPEENEINTGG